MNEIITKNENGEYEIAKQARDMIEYFELSKKKIDDEYKQYKAALLSAMEECGLKKIDCPTFTATYKAEYEREGVDSNKLRALFPDVFHECKKTTHVKSSVSVRLR